MKIPSVLIYCLLELIYVSYSIDLSIEQNTFSNMIEKEKSLIEQLKLNLAKNSHILINLDQQINLKSENKVCGVFSCFFLDKEKSNKKKHLYNKNLMLKEVLFDNFNEKILSFHILIFARTNNYDKQLTKQQKRNYLILFFTSNTFYVTDPLGKVQEKIGFNLNIMKVDFSTFDEDSCIVFLTDTSELYLLQLDLKVNGSITNQNTNEEFSVKLNVVSQKSKQIELKLEDIINFQQNRLMSNKYIIIGVRQGNVIVFNRELELRSSFVFPNSINNIYVHQGILGVFVNKQLVFMNMLGGNQVVVSCYNYFPMIDAVYDGLNNFLLAIDYMGNLLIFNAKIALSKQNSNECTQIYKYKIQNFNKYAKLKLYRQNLYIFTDTNYVAIVDLKHISDNGVFFVNEYFISHKNVVNNIDFVPNNSNSPTIEGSFISVEQGVYLFLKNEFLQEKNSFVVAKISNNKKVEKMIESNNYDGNDVITLPLGSAKSDSSWNVIMLYIFAIVAISLIVFYFKKKNPKKTDETQGKKGMTKKIFNEEEGKFLIRLDPKALEEMLSKLKSIEKATKEIKNKNSKEKVINKKPEEDEEIDEFDEEEEKSD